MPFKITEDSINGSTSISQDAVVDLDINVDGSFNWLVFKDTTNGKKYKLQVTNGAVELVEVT